MALFDIDILEGRVSKYETNHIHMVVDGDITYPITNMDKQQYGTFFHEYIHYMQHMTTLFGVKICAMYNKMFILYRDYIINNETIKLPLEIWKDHEGLKGFIDFFNGVKGSRTCNYNIDAIEISDKEILDAKKNKKAVKIGIYDFENGLAIENGFYFGYICIIESMAHLIQSFINDELYHATIPYCSVELICKSIYSEISNDKKMMISLCFCSLMFNNPGIAFFDLVELSKKNQSLNGYELYQKILKDNSVTYMGKEMPMYRALCLFLDDLKKSISSAISCKLDYYEEVIENCKNEIKSGNCVLLDILYHADISDKNMFSNVFEKVYGYPFIEAHNLTIMPMNNSEKPPKPYIETSSMIGLELIFKRMKSYSTNTKCEWFKICSKAQYTPDDKTTEECLCNQWQKNEKCIMTEALRYFNIKDKEYIQEK